MSDDPCVGDSWYRYEDRLTADWNPYSDDHGPAHVELQLLTYEVSKVTPKGVWIRPGTIFAPRFVLRSATKQFASPTEQEAALSFLARKERQVSILLNRVRHIRDAVAKMKRMSPTVKTCVELLDGGFRCDRQQVSSLRHHPKEFPMTKYLVIDTETSGLHIFAKKDEPPIAADAAGQPRMAGITMIPVDDAMWMDTEPFSGLIKPDGWVITPEITAINGLTTERCEAEGKPVDVALAYYAREVRAGRVVVAFNAQFDTKILRGELRLAGMDDLFELTRNICLMRASTGLGIVKAGEKKGGFPRLSDVYRHFYGEEPQGQHTSVGDAYTALTIMRRLADIDKLPKPAIHRSSTRKD